MLVAALSVDDCNRKGRKTFLASKHTAACAHTKDRVLCHSDCKPAARLGEVGNLEPCGLHIASLAACTRSSRRCGSSSRIHAREPVRKCASQSEILGDSVHRAASTRRERQSCDKARRSCARARGDQPAEPGKRWTGKAEDKGQIDGQKRREGKHLTACPSVRSKSHARAVVEQPEGFRKVRCGQRGGSRPHQRSVAPLRISHRSRHSLLT
eukprot:5918196-Pleurochrysis_carterae.AAC.1